MKTKVLRSFGLRLLTATALLSLLGLTATAGDDGWTPLGAEGNFAVWQQPTGDWYEAGDAMVDPENPKQLGGKPGTGVMINGKTGRAPSLVTKRRDFDDVELHVEFMVAKESNSGVIFHGNHEIQILDSYGVKQPTAGDCGGIYPPAEAKPSYHRLDGGSPPKVNAAKQPGEWQTLDIIFQSPRFDQAGKKTVHAKFVKAVLNGQLIQENQEAPWASGTNWDRKQFPRGPIILQGDYGPVAFRNVRVRPWKAGAQALNVPPEGFTALFNGKDLTGWHTPPLVKEYWSVEDGVLKSPGLIEQWGACLATKKHYRDFILMLDFRMPTISDSGINFRRLIPEIPGFGDQEQFNLRSKGGMGHLESYYFLPKDTAKKMGLKEEEKPHVRHIDPEIGVWHTVKLTMKGRTFSAEYDGEVLYDNFEYHGWMMNMEPAPIRLQKHIVVDGDNLGKRNPCPIEYRNIFIKELEPGAVEVPAKPRGKAAEEGKPLNLAQAEPLSQIDRNDLPKGYVPTKHQEYVDRRMAGLSTEQRATIGQLWKEKQRMDPTMKNRGASFVKILEHVAADSQQQQKPKGTNNTTPRDNTDKESRRKPAKRLPNVVVLLADDLGWKDIGCYGGPVKTPTLDSLAAQGVRFTDFHSGCAVCSPSRATLLTGRNHIRAGVYHVLQDSAHNAHLLEREVTLAEILKSSGYATAHFGKWHLGLPTKGRDKPTPDKHGFDYWFATDNNANPSHENPANFIRNGKPVGKIEGYSCQIVVNEAITWLGEKRDPDAPFFLNIWFHEPHAVVAAPENIVSQYGHLNDPAAIYSGTIENTDRAIARLLARLRELGVLENTLIVYSSDNGSYREDRNGGLRGSKGSNFEGGTCVPGIFYWPGTITKGRIENEPAGLVDLLPTVCGLLGIDKPNGVHLDGSDLSPLLTGRANQFARHQPLFWFLPTSNPAAAIRDGRYSLVGYRNYELPQDHRAMAALFKRIEEIVGKDDGTSGEGNLRSRVFNTTFANPEADRLRIQYVQLNTFQESWIPLIKAGGFGRFELYDVASDPVQQTNLFTKLPEVAARLKNKMLEINASVMTDGPDWVLK
jgi:arylsulfatase A